MKKKNKTILIIIGISILLLIIINMIIITGNSLLNIKDFFGINPNSPINDNLIPLEDNKCLPNLQNGEYVSGEIIISFSQEASKEQVELLLGSYGLSSDKIRFPVAVDYRIDFTGNKEGFMNYLNERGFTRRYHRNQNLFLLRSCNNGKCSDFKCEESNEIFYSYPNISIDKVYCFRHIRGIVDVPEGEEDKWACELEKSEIVTNVGFNGIVHAVEIKIQ